MRRWIMLFFGIIIISGMLVSEVKAEEVRQEFQRIIEQVEPAVVYIHARRLGENRKISIGSGVIVQVREAFKKSLFVYILTSYHVIKTIDYDVMFVSINNKVIVDHFTPLILNEEKDVALIVTRPIPLSLNFIPSAVELGDSEIVKEGDDVIAFGAPNGISTYATGNITNVDLNKKVKVDGEKISGDANHNAIIIPSSEIVKGLFQTNIIIDKGWSGGPLVDCKTGKVIGIIKCKDKNNIGYAILIDKNVKEVITNYLDSVWYENQQIVSPIH